MSELKEAFKLGVEYKDLTLSVFEDKDPESIKRYNEIEVLVYETMNSRENFMFVLGNGLAGILN